ncbi:MAG: HAMP domain-containing histidine kinase [Clostridia bacterium]|nr:HAMP domain-containing histidine kinase [Clostridia bacterium]
MKKSNDTKKPMRRKYNLFFRYMGFSIASVTISFLVLYIIFLMFVSGNWNNDRMEILQSNAMVIAEKTASLMADDVTEEDAYDSALALADTLNTVSDTIEADVFICDAEGRLVLCRHMVDTQTHTLNIGECETHSGFSMPSSIMNKTSGNGYSTVASLPKPFSGAKQVIGGAQVIRSGMPSGYVYAIATSYNIISPYSKNLTRMFVIAALISLIIMILLSYLFAAQLVRPMEKMSRLTKQYSKGNFSERLEVKGAKEQQELAESLNDMATSLSVIEDSRKSFIANVSHELKTPMTTIGGFVDGILDGTIPPTEERRYLGIVSSEIKRLARLVVTMLTLSKIEAGEESLNYSTTDLNQLLFDALLSFESAVDEGGYVIEGFEDLPHIKVQADSELLFQVAYNLFDNAVKFTNKGGTIRVGMEETDGRALVSISNTGKGIPEEEIHRIFERFYKVDKSRSEHVKGVGLGLNLAQDIVELHGGDIYAESEPGGFTSFRFWIPIEKTTDPQE